MEETKTDTTTQSNVSAAPVKEQTDSAEQLSEGQHPETTPPETTFDVDGEKLTLSEIKRLREDYANDSKWRDKNRRESEELNTLRKKLAPLELILPQIEQRPEVLQQLFAPKKSKDFDSAMREHYAKRPDGTDLQAYTQWEIQKDNLIREQSTSQAEEMAYSKAQKEIASRHNNETESYGREKYVANGKLNSQEWEEMNRWIVDNIHAPNGMYDKRAYDIAFKTVFEDRWLADVKIKATKDAVEPLKIAKTGGAETGRTKPPIQPTPDDEKNQAFVEAVRQSKRDKWMNLK